MTKQSHSRRLTAILALGAGAWLASPGVWAQCGPGPHWIDSCAAGIDNMNSSALAGIDTNFDCQPELSVILPGPIQVARTSPLDDSTNFPGTSPVDGHPTGPGLDVIDTDMFSMNLSGGGVTLRAGTNAGMAADATCASPGSGPVPRTCGVIVEQALNAAVGDSFFDVWFELDLGGGPLYNHTALRVSTAIDRVPPITDYMKVVGCLPLYDRPVGLPGPVLVAYLTTAVHNTIAEAHIAPVEYSNLADEQAIAGGGAQNGLDREQVLYTLPIDPVGPPFPFDSQDFGGAGEVDALANRGDAFFHSLLANQADLLISIAGDPLLPPGIAVYEETALGARGVKWAQINLSNPDPPGDLDDLDGLELWGPLHDGFNALSGWDANMYSLATDPGASSVYFYPFGGPGVPYVPQATIHAAVAGLGFTGPVGQVELDALMVSDRGSGSGWGPGDTIIFSIRAAASFDGGELIVLPFGGPASFLAHGGHLWNTAFGVGAAFGISTEEIDGLEAEPPKGDFNWGACRPDPDTCWLELETTCADLGGTYLGHGTGCSTSDQSNYIETPCDQSDPATCGGFCLSADEICTINATGTQCFCEPVQVQCELSDPATCDGLCPDPNDLCTPGSSNPILPSPELPPESQPPGTADCDQLLSQYEGQNVHALFPGGIDFSDPAHKCFINVDRQDDGSGNEIETFESTVDGQVDLGGGPVPVILTGPVTIVTYGKTGNTTGTFQTEMVSMSLTGDVGGIPIEIRESPSLQSVGQTSITDLGGGLWEIDSFFDVFTELSVGGGPFQPQTNGPGRMTLVPTTPSPCECLPAACDLSNPATCDGPCPIPGEICTIDPTGGPCFCEPPPVQCELSDPATCDGLCPDPNDLCTPGSSNPILPSPELPPESQPPGTADCDQLLSQYEGQNVHALFPGGIDFSDPAHKCFINVDRQDDGSGNEIETFESTVDGQVDLGGGPVPVILTGPVTIVTYGKTGNTTGTFQTEMVSMSLTGDVGGIPIEIRESPSLQSVGQTSITDLGGGLWEIDSFFDVFTELSVGGGPFQPQTNGPGRMTLVPTTPSPCECLPAACDLSNPATCDGPCPIPGEICTIDPTGGPCFCEPPPVQCELSDPATCDGLCPDPNDLCTPGSSNPILPSPELPPESQPPGTADCDQLLSQYEGQNVHALFPGGIDFSDPAHKCFINVDRQDDGSGNEIETFESTVDGQVDLGGGPVPVILTGPVTIVTYGKTGNTTGTFQTEMVSMSLTGDVGGIPIEIRESPSLQSVGQTSITDLGGGLWEIDSFFDVFTELSVGGGPFQPQTNGPGRMTLVPTTPNPCFCERPPLLCAESFGPVCEGACPPDHSCKEIVASLPCECVPCINAVPGPVKDVLFQSKIDFDWQALPCAVVYNVYRLVATGLVDADSDGLADGPWPCFLPGLVTPQAADTTDPSSSWLYYYLITGENTNGEGTMGWNSSLQERPNSSPCP